MTTVNPMVARQRYMVSYRYSWAGSSGNHVFDTPEEAIACIEKHWLSWHSYATYTYVETGALLSDLTPVTLISPGAKAEGTAKP